MVFNVQQNTIMNNILTRLNKLIIIFIFLGFTTIGVSQNQIQLKVSGACGMCKTTIQKTAKKVNGVNNANYNLSDNLLYLEVSEGFDRKIISDAINAVGYDTELGKAPLDVYNDLPMCCQYRDMEAHLETGDHMGDDHNVEHQHLEEQSPFLKGHVVERQEDGSDLPLIGATIQWLNAPLGSTTDIDGAFEVGRISATDMLVISYVGFNNDTINTSHLNNFYHVMNSNLVMDEVVITHRKNTSEISFIDPLQTVTVSEEELCKAACCSLSESFETSPSIDMSFTDAVTGTRQIQMLGLAGKYVQISRELIPDIRSISAVEGLSLTPGAWVESIQLSKGTGSVVNGFESMTGQINIELRKPEKKDNVFLNLYGDISGRYEANLFTSHKINKNFSTAFLLHSASRHKRIDGNDDGFLDNALMDNFIGINRWKYQNANGWQAQLGVKYSSSDKTAGQFDYNPRNVDYTTQPLPGSVSPFWGASTELSKIEAWSKIGKVISEENNSSFGLQLSAGNHVENKLYGTRLYNVDHQNLYANFIYQSELSSPEHVYKIGASFLSDKIDESVTYDQTINYNRDEMIPGAFLEYTYLPTEKVTLVAGIRGDQHNNYGFQVTPRLHFRYAPTEDAVFRIVAGSGWRTPNVFAENTGMFASNRNYSISGDDSNKPYGLDREKAWNMGANWTQNIYIGTRKAVLSLDYYYTKFDNQVIMDYNGDHLGTINYTNQNGNSYAHSFQSQLDLEPIDKLNIRMAYRYNFAEAKFGNTIRTIPFNSFHRAFINTAYEMPKGWHVDLTVNWKGSQRIPGTYFLPVALRPNETAEPFFLANTQIRKVWKEQQFEIYAGMENILDYKLDDPIVSAINPNSPYFDASLVWGPIFGRNIYFGMRYRM